MWLATAETKTQTKRENTANPMASPTVMPERNQEDRQLPRSPGKFVSHVLALVTGNGIAQAVTMAGTLLLARLVAPDAFGSFALFVTLVSFLSVLGGGRYELAVMLPERDEEAANVLFLAVFIVFGIAAFSLAVVALFHTGIAVLVGDAKLSLWLWGVPLALVFNGLYQVLAVWHGRMKRFHWLANARVLQALGTIMCQLVLLIFYSGGFALIGGWFLGQALGAGFLLSRIVFGDTGFLLRAFRWMSIREALATHRNFPLYKAPLSFMANSSSQLVVVILRLFTGLDVVGLYSLAARAVYLPVTLIASSMNDVFYQKAATELKHGRLESFVTRLLRIQVVLAAPFLVLAAFDAKLIFGAMLGAKWTLAGTYAAILVFASFMYFLTSWLDRLFDVRGRQRLSLALESTRNLLALGGLTLVLWHSDNAVAGIATYAGLQVLYCSTWLAFAYRVAGFNPRALLFLLRDALMSVLGALTLIGVIHAVVHGWTAFFASAGAALLMSTIAFIRYVSTGRAYSSTADRFRLFWSDKDNNLIDRDQMDFRRARASEIRNLFPNRLTGKVLEIGCGDGSLFPHLQIPAAQYVGVDFSPQFIDKFRAKYPAAKLECVEGASYQDGDRYNLILLDRTVQHFDPEMLEQHLRNASIMMGDDGRLIWGSIPRRRLRMQFDLGVFGGTKPGLVRVAKSWVARLVGLDAMGYWYEPVEIEALAEKYGLQAEIVVSSLSPYRFHAVLSKAEPRAAGVAVRSAQSGSLNRTGMGAAAGMS
jgi:O-antigen/teichoic acid export membrane protein/SAM-dependent methyltransferase